MPESVNIIHRILATKFGRDILATLGLSVPHTWAQMRAQISNDGSDLVVIFHAAHDDPANNNRITGNKLTTLSHSFVCGL